MSDIYIGQFRRFVYEYKHFFQVVDICRGLVVGKYMCEHTYIDKFSPTSLGWILENSSVSNETQNVCCKKSK